MDPAAQNDNNHRILTTKGIFNRLPGVNAAKNKRTCAQIFERMHQLYPEDFNLMPRSFVMPEDKEKL